MSNILNKRSPIFLQTKEQPIRCPVYQAALDYNPRRYAAKKFRATAHSTDILDYHTNFPRTSQQSSVGSSSRAELQKKKPPKSGKPAPMNLDSV